MNTRISNDRARIIKQNEILTEQGRYMLNVPGPGENVPFIEDPHVRLQYWAANMRTNTTDVDADLRGLTRRLGHHTVEDAVPSTTNSAPLAYSSYSSPVTDYSRTTAPAWMLRGIEIPRWERPLLNPIDKAFSPFPEPVSTRLVQKDELLRRQMERR